MAFDLTGKWEGTVQGTNNGTITIDVHSSFAGTMTLQDQTYKNITKAKFVGHSIGSTVYGLVRDFSIEPQPRNCPTSGSMHATVSHDGKQIIGLFITDIGTNGMFVLNRAG